MKIMLGDFNAKPGR